MSSSNLIGRLAQIQQLSNRIFRISPITATHLSRDHSPQLGYAASNAFVDFNRHDQLNALNESAKIATALTINSNSNHGLDTASHQSTAVLSVSGDNKASNQVVNPSPTTIDVSRLGLKYLQAHFKSSQMLSRWPITTAELMMQQDHGQRICLDQEGQDAEIAESKDALSEMPLPVKQLFRKQILASHKLRNRKVRRVGAHNGRKPGGVTASASSSSAIKAKGKK